jgi:tRNA nucleotidyltransferase (CCA-adding enzyme)
MFYEWCAIVYNWANQAMTDNVNLATRIAETLPREITAFLEVASAEAAARHWRLYLVGGTVRDLMLGRPGFDLDLSVEGDAIELAKAIAATPEDLVVHHRFNTARVKWGAHHIDLARSREETYARPGALPTVRPGTIEHDLFRRDLSINAMALSLNNDDWGRLIDLHGGSDDLRRRFIRVLHPNSFIDDATRIWRAVRYEQRLDFRIEPETLSLLRRDREMLRTITADRLRYELECVLAEAMPEKVFKRADELGLLVTWHPSLHGDRFLSDACARARTHMDHPSPEIYLSLLAWRLNANEKEELIATLRLTKSQTRALRDGVKIADKLETLDLASAKPSTVCHILRGLGADAIAAAKIAIDSPVAVSNIARYLADWRHVAPSLTGDDLKRMGVSRGPDIKALLDEIRDLRLDGIITSRQQEESFTYELLRIRS